MVVKTGVKYPSEPINFVPSVASDPEVMRIRGYKPSKTAFVPQGPPPKERTYIMIKPDGVQRGLIGQIMERFETKGFKLVGMKLAQPGKEMFEKHYADLSKKGFFKGLVEYAASGPVCCMVWEGDNAVKTGRKMLGATKPFDSEPGTIRGDFCIDVGRNVIHGSDSVESANHEISLWFAPEEIVDWTNHSDTWVYE
jgi:nucleoside-diphosphate kinase